MEHQKIIDQTYTIMETGGITLNSKYLFELNWEPKKPEAIFERRAVIQFLDKKRERLILINAYYTYLHIPVDGFRDAIRIVGRKFPISSANFVTLDKGARFELEWAPGTKIRQILDKSIDGIIIEKVEEEDPLTNTVKLSELNETKKE